MPPVGVPCVDAAIVTLAPEPDKDPPPTMKFFRLVHPDQEPGTVVVVAEDTEASMLLRWVPDTGLWHRVGQLEADFLFGDDAGTYEPLTVEEAVELLPQVREFGARCDRRRRTLAALKALPESETRTNREMGISRTVTPPR